MIVTKVNILNRPRFAMAVAGALAGVLVLLAVWGTATGTAQAAGERDIFTVRAVLVDTTAVNVAQAREQGFVAGRIAAFWKLIERLVAPEDIERVPQPSAGEVITMVRDFSIASERSSAVRYLAELTVRFHPGPVRALLRAAGVLFTETVSKPLVVIPLYREQAGARLLLWEDPNPWRSAWMEPAADNGLVPFALPLGDIDDLTTLSVEQAVAGNNVALDALAARYQTGGTLVAVAEVSTDTQALSAPSEELEPGTAINVLLTLTARHRDLLTDQLVLSYAGAPGEDLEDVLVAAADTAAAAVQNTWKVANRVAFDSMTQITVLVPVTGIQQWVKVKNQLEAVPLIERLNLQAMTRDRAQFTLVYAGNVGQFNLALAQKDLEITQRGDVWVIETLMQGDVDLAEFSSPSRGLPQPPDGPVLGEAVQ